MEIFSYIVDGELSHRDSMGNQEALPRGCVQYMSAGTGVIHSEMNEGDTTCRFIQVRRVHSVWQRWLIDEGRAKALSMLYDNHETRECGTSFHPSMNGS
jgi:redox-sensitive bicupin YhaK (pirin superfamily)